MRAVETPGSPTVWVVAGCLFEIGFADGDGWSWAGGDGSVTLLGEDGRDGRRHFRFRAEGEGAEGADAVKVRFQRPGGVCHVTVHIAPERMP